MTASRHLAERPEPARARLGVVGRRRRLQHVAHAETAWTWRRIWALEGASGSQRARPVAAVGARGAGPGDARAPPRTVVRLAVHHLDRRGRPTTPITASTGTPPTWTRLLDALETGIATGALDEADGWPRAARDDVFPTCSRGSRQRSGAREADLIPDEPMTRTVVIHGHFYQPPRENPWLRRDRAEASAAPFHDWNARIEHECVPSRRRGARPRHSEGSAARGASLATSTTLA